MNKDNIEHIHLIRQYAKAWNNLSMEFVEPYLSEDFHFASQIGFDEIKTKNEYLMYINEKFNIIKISNAEGDSFLNAEIGFYNNNPCLILLQIHNQPKMTGSLKRVEIDGKKEWVQSTSKAIETVMLVKCDKGKIVRSDLCVVPASYDIQRTGEIPL